MDPLYRFFLASRPYGPAKLLALHLIKADDVETKPGLTTTLKKVWICDICHLQIHVSKQILLWCNRIEHWVNLRCAGVRRAQYTDRPAISAMHTYITPPPPPPRPWSKIGNTQSYCLHSTWPDVWHQEMYVITSQQGPILSPTHTTPPIPSRAKHIHISHTPPTPRTTVISSTLSAVDTKPEPRVPPIYLTHTHHTSSILHTSIAITFTLSQHTHMQHKQQYMQKHMQISSQFRKPSSPLKQKHPKYINSQQCAPIGCTWQGVGSLHSLATTLHSL